jgi:ammonia channel protein AmtB
MSIDTWRRRLYSVPVGLVLLAGTGTALAQEVNNSAESVINGANSAWILTSTALVLYTLVVSFALYKLVGAITGLRVSGDKETEGLDIALHNESGYDLR